VIEMKGEFRARSGEMKDAILLVFPDWNILPM